MADLFIRDLENRRDSAGVLQENKLVADKLREELPRPDATTVTDGPQLTTKALGEEGSVPKGDPWTTMALGEEGTVPKAAINAGHEKRGGLQGERHDIDPWTDWGHEERGGLQGERHDIDPWCDWGHEERGKLNNR